MYEECQAREEFNKTETFIYGLCNLLFSFSIIDCTYTQWSAKVNVSW